MSDSHLLNTIRLLRRSGAALQWQVVLNGPPQFSGEMAQYYADQDYDHLIDLNEEDFTAETYPLYSDLCDEAERRKLPIP